MERRMAFVVTALLAATFVAAVLHLLLHGVFGFSNRNIVIDSMAAAGLLCIMFSLELMRERFRK
jgi:hypothetical protein